MSIVEEHNFMFTKEEILSARFYKHPYNRIFDRVRKSENGCMEFQGGLDIHGYGKIKIKNHNMGTHKVAYILCKGDVPEGMVVMHSCDNPRCVNPEHLNLGTQRENIEDCIKKGRHPKFSSRRVISGYSDDLIIFFKDIYEAEDHGYKNSSISMSCRTGKKYKGFLFSYM